jgi:Ni,Fe-hydrogenase III large subunit
MVIPGGVRWGFPIEKKKEFLTKLDVIANDTFGAINLLFKDSIILSRFEHCGVITRPEASAIGLVGVSARASSLTRDIRKFENPNFIPSVCDSGDVLARAKVRAMEIKASLEIIRKLVPDLPERPQTLEDIPSLSPSSLAVSFVEGWRGEVCHVALTDENGKFLRYKIVDPSFHNWFGLALALRGVTISDFPLNNKSFNLSYCGHDL